MIIVPDKRWLLPLFILAGIVIGALLFFLAVNRSADGLGTYLPAISFFPYSMAMAAAAGSFRLYFVIIALIQYPAYGWIVGATWQRSGRKKIWIVLACCHVLCAIVAGLLARSSGNFWP